MANNELSGIVVSSYIANWLSNKKYNKFSYRFVFIPETIGSITYLSKHYVNLKKKVIAGFNVSCIGDERSYSYLPSRNGNTISDKVAKQVFFNIKKKIRMSNKKFCIIYANPVAHKILIKNYFILKKSFPYIGNGKVFVYFKN
jgi:aminopeptidase-like protein